MKRRIISVLFCFLFLASCLPFACLAAGKTYTVVNDNGTYLYYLASTASAKLALIRVGAVLTAQEEKDGFIKTTYQGYHGWVSAADLSAPTADGIWGILIDSPPEKTVYYEDDEFVSDGLKVTAVYNDGTRVAASGFSVAAPDMHSVGRKNVFVTWQGKTASFPIEVRRLPIDRIEVTSLPFHTTVIEDSDTYDPAGLVVTAYYTDGREPQQVTGYRLSGIDPNRLGVQKVNVNYKYDDINTDFEIEVVKKKEIDLHLTRIPDKTVYYENDLSPDITGLLLTVDYDNGKSASVRPDKVEFKLPISTEHKNTILVYYSRFMTEYYVDVFAEAPVRLELELPSSLRFPIGSQPGPDALSGLRVYQVLNSGRKKETTDYSVDPIDTSAFGPQTVNVYSGDLSASFTVYIVSDAPPGDVNKDGKVNSKDARLTLRCASRLIAFTDEEKSAGDVNGDGKITTTDARIILRHASHIELIPGVNS